MAIRSHPRTKTFLGAVLLLFVLTLGVGPAFAADEELAWEDGNRGGKQSAAGTGHVIAFEHSGGTRWLRAIKVQGARYGVGYDPKETKFTVAVCDEDLQPLTSFEAPYSTFPLGSFAWKEIPLPRVIQVPERFQVVLAFSPTERRGVFVGWSKTSATHSAYGLPCQGTKEYDAGREWMIRALVVTKPPRGAVKETIAGVDDGKKLGHKSLGGSGHIVQLRKPSGKWWIASVLVYGQRYGGGYDPKTTTFKIAITKTSGAVVQEQEARYARFSQKAFGWVEVFLQEPVKAAAKFRVAVDFDPGQTKGVYVAYGGAGGKAPYSFTGKPGAKGDPFPDGSWMIRARLLSVKPEPPPVEEVKRDPQEYFDDFEFLRRTIRDEFPSFEKKRVDWDAVCEEWMPRFEACRDDETHVLNARQLLAVLGDMHSGVTETSVEADAPAFDGLYGAGLWIATEGDQVLVRALMPNHELEGQVSPGAILVSVDGTPARFVLEEVRRKLKRWSGWSSDHFLDARLSTQFFPFGPKNKLRATFLNPGGGVVKTELKRWGPGGKGVSRTAVTMPPEMEAKGFVVAKRLLPYLGYIRILGGMDDNTKAAFSDAMLRVKDTRALILDCRGMGGGGDGPAWEMAGRFFSRNIPFKHDPVLKPSGEWQYEAPVVMLTDERMISSAETFTWAMAETLRAITVGRPTGGATIIPRRFEVPSGIFKFRLGCRDRGTSVNGVHPEGKGTAPKVYVPYDAELLTRFQDPILAAGFDVALMLALGAPRSLAVETYGGILGADSQRVQRAQAEWRGYPKSEDLLIDDLDAGLVDAMVHMLANALEEEANTLPDAIGGSSRLGSLKRIAHILGREKTLVRAQEVERALSQEKDAQEAFRAMIQREYPPTEEALDDFWAAHEGTRWARAVVDTFQKSGD